MVTAIGRVVWLSALSVGCGHLGIDFDPEATDSAKVDSGNEADSGAGGDAGSRGAGGGAVDTDGITASGGDGSASGGAPGNGGDDGSGGDEGSGGDTGGDGGSGGTDGSGGDEGSGGESSSGGANGSGGVGGSGGESNSGGMSGAGGSPPLGDCSAGTFGPLEMIEGLGVVGEKWGPSVTGDGLVLYFAVASGSSERIYRSTRSARDGDFGPASQVTELNAQSTRVGTPFVNFDDTGIYFFVQTSADQTTRDIWHASRDSAEAPFSNLAALTSVNQQYRDHLPWLSKDELTIFFTSARPLNWNVDIWTATRSHKSSSFGTPTAVSTGSASSDDGSPSLTPDGLTMYFTSDRGSSFDVYSAKRSSLVAAFDTPILETGLSSSSDDVNVHLSPDGHEVFVSSDRSGNEELWVAWRDCGE